ncbi:MAG: hypothetical protein COB02_18255 [Candidatus Cloacimonadota bacterium]|nr:MAG: hypothetical protein COB02_18255 [Candidatus Cloacimonadota bacterium]
MSDSLARYEDIQEELGKGHKSFVEKRPKNLSLVLSKGLQDILMKKDRPEKAIGIQEQTIKYLIYIMDKLDDFEVFIGLKPEFIKIEDAKLYYPECLSANTIKKLRCQGKNLPYIIKIEGRLYIDSLKYEMHRRAKRLNS